MLIHSSKIRALCWMKLSRETNPNYNIPSHQVFLDILCSLVNIFPAGPGYFLILLVIHPIYVGH